MNCAPWLLASKMSIVNIDDVGVVWMAVLALSLSSGYSSLALFSKAGNLRDRFHDVHMHAHSGTGTSTKHVPAVDAVDMGYIVKAMLA